MRRVLFLTAMGFLLLGMGGANSAYSATTTTSLEQGGTTSATSGQRGLWERRWARLLAPFKRSTG